MKNLKSYMVLCDHLAVQAYNEGNSAVGCLMVHRGKIIATSYEISSSKEDITRHAEIELIRKVRGIIGTDMSECTLISSHEPCVMCGYVIRYHRVGEVIYQNQSSHFGSISSSMNILTTDQVPKSWGEPPTIIHYS